MPVYSTLSLSLSHRRGIELPRFAFRRKKQDPFGRTFGDKTYPTSRIPPLGF